MLRYMWCNRSAECSACDHRCSVPFTAAGQYIVDHHKGESSYHTWSRSHMSSNSARDCICMLLAAGNLVIVEPCVLIYFVWGCGRQRCPASTLTSPVHISARAPKQAGPRDHDTPVRLLDLLSTC